MTRVYTYLIILFSSIPFLSEGQSFYAVRRNRDFIINAGSGIANYFGELVNPGQLGKVKPNLVLGAEYYFTKRIAARGEITWFQIGGSDANANDDRVVRNLSFNSNNYEISLSGLVNFFPNGHRFYQRPQFNIYGFVGAGLLFMNPTTRDSLGNKHSLQPLQTEGVKYNRMQPVIPFGFGVKYKVGPFLNILVEGGYRLTFTDYLDDISIKRYPDPATLSSDLSRSLSNRSGGRALVRGNPENNDGYFLLNVKVQYYLPVQVFNRGQNRKLYNQKRRAIYRKHR